MSDVIEYKCPFCGGAMEFDSKSQHMKCLYCNTEMTVEEFQRTQKPEAETAAEKKTAKENWFSLSSGQWQKDETNHMRVYSCQSCGGEIVADETTGATTCPFCNNKVTIKGQFSGDLKPDYIIPFKLDKKAAKKRYYSHLEGRKYLPKVFRKENHVDEIKGVYIPFWLFDVDAYVQITYEAEKVHVQVYNQRYLSGCSCRKYQLRAYSGGCLQKNGRYLDGSDRALSFPGCGTISAGLPGRLSCRSL